MAEANADNESVITGMYKDRRQIALEAIFTAVQNLVVVEESQKLRFTQRLDEMGELVRSVGGPRLFAERSFEQIIVFIRETQAMQDGLLPELETTHMYYQEIIDTMNFSTFYDGRITFKRLQAVMPPWPLNISGGQFSRRREDTTSSDEQQQEAQDMEARRRDAGWERRRSAAWPYFAPIPGVYLPFGELSDDQKKILEERKRARYYDDDVVDSDDDSLPDLVSVDDDNHGIPDLVDAGDEDNDIADLVVAENQRRNVMTMSVNTGHRQVLPQTHPLRQRDGSDASMVRTVHGVGLFLSALHNQLGDDIDNNNNM